MAQEQILLTSTQKYRSELYAQERLSEEAEEVLIEQARSGDQEAREAVVLMCLQYVAAIAWRYVSYTGRGDEYLDLVGIGNLSIVEHLDTALTICNPKAFLFGTARWEMIRYCIYHSTLIPRHTRTAGAVPVSSLDEPLACGKSLNELLPAEEPAVQDTPEKTYDYLYQAIDLLREKYRFVVLRHYGLDGDAPEELADISKRLSSNPKKSLAYGHHKRALRNLRTLLTTDMRESA